MPEFDVTTHQAGVQERRTLLEQGWPAYLEWQPTPPVLAQLNALCAARRDALRYPWAAVTDPEPAEVADTYEALRVGLVEAGLPPRLAEWAADNTRTLHWMTLVECVRWTAQSKPEGWLRLDTPMNGEISPPQP